MHVIHIVILKNKILLLYSSLHIFIQFKMIIIDIVIFKIKIFYRKLSSPWILLFKILLQTSENILWSLWNGTENIPIEEHQGRKKQANRKTNRVVSQKTKEHCINITKSIIQNRHDTVVTVQNVDFSVT